MLRIIDRYLLMQFVQIFVICYVSFTGLYIVIDAFSNLDDFMHFARTNDQSLARVFVEYYAYRSLYLFSLTSSILPLVAAMFTVTWIERYNELTALMAAGVSRFRVLRPVIIAALLLAVVAGLNRELLMPSLREKLVVDSKNLGGDSSEELVPRYDRATDILLNGDQAIVASGTIVNPNFVLPSKLSNYGKQLAASEGTYLPATSDRPSGYLLSGVTIPQQLGEKPSLQLGERYVVVTPHDASWLKGDEIFVASDVALQRLTGNAKWKQFASTAELIEELRSPSADVGNSVRMEIHTRILQPFLDGTLLFLGLPLMVSRNNRNLYLAIGMATLVVVGYMGVSLCCQWLGNDGFLRPALAAWLPLIIFCPVAVYLADSLRK